MMDSNTNAITIGTPNCRSSASRCPVTIGSRQWRRQQQLEVPCFRSAAICRQASDANHTFNMELRKKPVAK
jgi:hypothetical protein